MMMPMKFCGSRGLTRSERMSETKEPFQKENTIRGHIDDYLALKKAQCQAKGKIASYSSVRQWLEVFEKLG